MMDDKRSLMDQAVAAAQRKDFPSARNLLRQLLRQEPNNLNAWLLAAHVVETRSDAIRCYQQVLRLDPGHAYARQKLSQLQSPPAAPAPVAPPKDRPDLMDSHVDISPKQQAVLPDSETSRPPTVNRPRVGAPPQRSPKSASRTGMIVLLGILIGLFCLVVAGIVFSVANGGFLTSAQPTPTSQQLFDVLYQNSRAANGEDVDAYMATIHPKSPLYRQTKSTLMQIFSQYDLEFRFYDLQVVSLKTNEAQVHFSLSTRKINGPGFMNNVLIGTMTLRPDKGVWKIYGQEVENVQPEQ